MSLASKSRALSSPPEHEQGIIAILAAVAIPVVLIMVGFVVDLGRLYKARLEFQKAADAGALAGIAASALQSDRLVGKSPEEIKEFIELRAEETTLSNLALNGYADIQLDDNIAAEFVIPLNPEDGRPSVEVEITADVPFILMNLIPEGLFGNSPINSFQTLNVQARVQRNVANVVLLLDVSRSMSCPSIENDTCACLTPERTETCSDVAAKLGAKTRLEHLQEAVQNFVNRFNPSLDRISIVPYNIAAEANAYNDQLSGITNKKSVRFKPYAGQHSSAQFGFDPLDLRNAVLNLEAKSNTNLSDGLIRGYLEAKRVGLINQEPINWVIFGDGAQTAMRILLTEEAVSGLEQNNPDGIGLYDYMLYSVYWAVPPKKGVIQNAAYPGPSPLVRSQSLPLDHDLPEPPKDKNNSYLAILPACTNQNLEKDPTKYAAVVNNCIKNFKAHLPDHSELTWGENFVPFSLDLAKPKESMIELRVWQELFYASALQMADFLRTKNGTFYIAGLGQALPIAEDPYQFDALNKGTDPVSQLNLMRKDVMLSRIANDFNQAVVERKKKNLSPYPEFSYSGYKTYQNLLEGATHPRQGQYMQALVAQDLDGLFDAIASEILIQIVD